MWDTIEAAIQARHAAEAKRLMLAELKRSRRDGETLFKVCNGLRRLGLYLDGLRALELSDRGLQHKRTTSDLEGRKLLWAARFLNLLGAPTFSRSLAERIEPRTHEDHRILGLLSLSYYEPRLALTHFERMRELDPSPESYLSRVAWLSYADANADLGRLEPALGIITQIEQRSQEPLILAICLRVRGEYLARLERWEEAHSALEAAHARFPQHDESPDFALACKWFGYVRLRLSRKTGSSPDSGRKLFAHAHSILHSPSIRPEIWIDSLLLRERADPEADAPRRSALTTYPLCPTGYLRELARPRGLTSGLHAKDAWRIDLATRETWQKGKPRLGVSKEVQLVALARLAWPWPLNPVTAQALLWPDEAYSFPQLAERLKKLLARTRTELKIPLRMERGWITAPEEIAQKVCVTTAEQALPPSLLWDRGELAPRDVDDYYDLSHTQRALTLKDWSQRGWVEPKGKRYRVSGL